MPIHWITIAVIHFVLISWYVSRFGKVANLEVRSPQANACDALRRDWLAPPRRSALSAIAWKQARESAPLVLAGLAGVVGIVAIFSVTVADGFGLTQFGELFAGVSVSLGFAVAMIVGIGVCLADVGPGLSTFWRSRPINSDLWFWTKFATGLLVLLAAVYVPLIIVIFAVHPNPPGVLFHPNAVVMPPAHLAIFAAAVAMTCLVRHTVYAAILSIALVYLGSLTGLGLWLLAGLVHLVKLKPDLWWNPTQEQVAFGMMTSFVISTIIAWLAMRYDWGLKSRY